MKLLLAFLTVFFVLACDNSDVKAQGTNKLSIVSADGTGHVFSVELALTPQQQAYGLMNRTSMPQDHGMLFVFGDEAERGFWMKNTLIPLDMVFIKKNGVIHHIHENAIPHDLTTNYSKGPVMAVLELNGGTSARLNIKPGDVVKHAVFGIQR
jgi:uncharacterized membrane protein (UPF0127 family)